MIEETPIITDKKEIERTLIKLADTDKKVRVITVLSEATGGTIYNVLGLASSPRGHRHLRNTEKTLDPDGDDFVKPDEIVSVQEILE